MDDATKLRVVNILLDEIFDCEKCDDASSMYVILCAICDIINDKEKETNDKT